MTTHPLRAPLLGLLLVACVSARGGDGAVVDAPPSSASAPSVSPQPSILGFRLEQDPESSRARGTDIAFTTSDDALVAQAEVEVDGVSYRTHLTFYEEQLARVSASAYDVTLADLEGLVRQLEAELGPGARQICSSEIGPPLEAYLASGRGGVHVEWATERVRASVSLSPSSQGTLGLNLYAELTPLADRHREELDFKGARHKQAASTCSEVASHPPTAAGFTFGDSADALREQLGTDVNLERYQTVPHPMAGVDGQLALHFYDGCLAVVLFEAPGTEESYRAIQAALLHELGEPERREQCSPTGEAPTAQELAASQGRLRTRWQTAAMHAEVRLGPGSSDRSPRVTVEISAQALSERAPHIDFDGQ